MKRRLVEIPKMFIMVMTFSITYGGVHGHTLYAQERPVKEFFITVQEMTIPLLEDPQKEATVWAYAL